MKRVLTPATAAVLAALWGALGAPPAWAAGTKTSGTSTIVDDVSGGAAGMVNATAAGATLDGGVGQTSTLIESDLTPGATVEAGYFTMLAATPTAASFVQINASSASFQWANAIAPNPSGTTYIVDLSTDAAFGGRLVSMSTYAFAGTVTGLKGNTSYYARIRANYLDGDDSTPLVFGGQKVTLAVTPGGGLVYDNGPFALRALWDSQSNTQGDLAATVAALASLPAIRQSPAMTAYAGRLYVSGGLDSAPQSTVWTAAIASDGSLGGWTTTTALPVVRQGHAMAAWGGRLYVIGGSDGATRATAWWAPIRADGTVGDWTATTSLPAARMNFGLVAWGGKLYAAGGSDVSGSQQANVYYASINDDGTLGAWSNGPSLPTAVESLAMAVSSGTLYVAGGHGGAVSSEVWWSALSGAGVPGAWNTTSSLPNGLTRHAMSAADGRLYVAGGSDGATIQAATWVGTLNADGSVAGWSPGTPLPAARLQHAMAAIGDRIYVAGGSDGGSAQSNVWTTALTGTQSLAELAGDPSFSTSYSSSGWRSQTSFDFAGLSPNTTYYTRVTARSFAGALTSAVRLGSTVTLAALPGVATSTFSDVEVGSVTFQWTLGSNAAGTQFLAEASTAPDFTGTLSVGNWITAVSTSFAGLSVNTSYYLRVQARNSLQIATPFTVVGATYTLALPPTNSTITASNASGLTLTWSPGSDPGGTYYEAQVANGVGFSTVLQSSVTQSTTAIFSGLTSANTFYARVRALNGNGIPTAFDAVVSTATGVDPVPPGVATGTFAAQSGSPDTLTAFWTVPGDNGYSGTLVAGAKFLIQWSTSAPSAVTWSTSSAQVSVATGPLVPGSLAGVTVSGLPDQALVFFREWTRDQAGNYSGASSTFSAYTTPFSFEFLAGGGGFDAGSSPAIAVDRSGNLHVAYRGTTGTQELNYNKRTGGVWGTPVTIDPGVPVTNIALALDPSDSPVIAYTDSATPQLKWARLVNGAWTTGAIESGSDRAGGLAVDASGGVNLSYYVSASGRLKYGRWNGVSWSTQTIDTSGDDAGRDSSLALDASQQPHVSYYDATTQSLKYASTTAGGVWSVQTVDSGVNVGTATVIAVDAAGRAHIAYGDVANRAVKCASATASGWSVRVVEASGNDGGLRLGLALDGAGIESVSYSDRGSGALKFAQWTGTAFSTQTVDATTDAGVESALALDGSGGAHIAYRDATNKGFRVAHWTSASAFPAFSGNAGGRAQAPSGMTATVISTTTIQWSWTDNASDEAGFRLYGSFVSTGPFALIAGTQTITASAGTGAVKSYIESGLTAGTTYYRYAVAVGTGGVAVSAVVSANPFNTSDFTPPTVVNHQTGDLVWRRANTGIYSVSFFDTGGSHLSKFQVKASTMPGGVGPDLVAFTDVVTNIGADSYASPWPLPAAVFNAMIEGATNYVTVQVFDGMGNVTISTDVFYVRKDTDAPVFINGQANDGTPRMSAPPPAQVAVADPISGLTAFQYSVSTTAASGDASVIGWTDIAAIAAGTTSYATPWPVNFTGLFLGATNYVSVRAWDVAGSTRVLVDAFYLVRVAGGPAVTIASPAAAFVSSASTISGAAADAFGVTGVSLSFQQTPPTGMYWSGTGFNSAGPVWFAASGTLNWSYSASAITWADQTVYAVVARSTDAGGNFSSVYATSTFTTDFTAPTAGVVQPASGASISTFSLISGTAADPGGASASGVGLVEIRLKRLSDGLWWNFVTQAWSPLAVSSSAAGTAAWTFAPSPLLVANLSNAASYYIAVRADDNAAPANSGSFFSVGSATFTFVDTAPPGGVVNLSSVTVSTPGALGLSWTAPGENGSSGVILSGQYRIQYSTFAGASYSTAAAQIAFATGTVVPGSAQSRMVLGLSPGATYYVGLWIQNTSGNWSPLSNLVTAYAQPGVGAIIAGHVIQVSSQGITGVEIDAFDSNGALQGIGYTQADGSGTYVLSGLPSGFYKVQARWSANGITNSVWLDGVPLGTTSLDFVLQLNYNLATLTGTLNTLGTLGRHGTSVSGSFHGLAFFDPKAAPDPGQPRVELFQNSRQVAMVAVPDGGRWKIPNLLPGHYAVRSYNGIGYTDLQGVDLIEGETKTMAFVYDPLPKDQVFVFPNPAKQSATFRFQSSLSPIAKEIRVFDVAGNLVKELGDSDIQLAPPSSGVAVYHAIWDLTNSRGESVASGVYLFAVKVKGGDNQSALVVKKVAVVK